MQYTWLCARASVFAADLGLEIRIPSLKIFCFDTKQFEEYTTVTDKEINEEIIYVKRE
jgi:hypothetical protein